MNKPVIHGFAKLATDGVIGLSQVVESMHARVQGQFFPTPSPDRLGGISGLVYRGIRGGTRAVAIGLDLAMHALPAQGDKPSTQGPGARRLRAVLNGVLGDHLRASGNALALPMRFFQADQANDLNRADWATGVPGSELLIAIHGLCMGPHQWCHRGQDHAADLAKRFGWAPLYLEYNSGLHISDNGADLAEQMHRLVASWPVPVTRIVILAHSMGGLVTRSALAQANAEGLSWPEKVSDVMFLGTPHQGAPLEAVGHQVDRQMRRIRYLAPFALIGGSRSVGIMDLKRPNLLMQDWQTEAPRSQVPWPQHIKAGVIAGTLELPEALATQHWLGDGLVPVRSALGESDEPGLDLGLDPSRKLVLPKCGHFDLLADMRVQQQLQTWLEA
ncbi:MAG: alpha/beta hydrolase [Ahniella sp.]|nr:alpha/beta hydrolase [Ahniella sp.]